MATPSRRPRIPVSVQVLGLGLLLLLPLAINDYLLFVVNLILVYCLVTLGFNIVFGYLGQLAFANAAFFGIGAYAVAIFTTHLNLPYWLALPLAGLTGAVAGLLVGLPALRLKGFSLAIVTLVFGELMRWGYLQGGQLTMGATGLPVSNASLFGLTLDTERGKYFFLLLVTIVCVLSTRSVVESRIGRAWSAVRENEAAAASLGLWPAFYKIVGFGWSGLLVGLAGGMYALLIGRVNPEDFSLAQLLLHFAMVMIGGVASISGSIIGALVLTAAPEMLRGVRGLQEIMFSLLLIVVLLFMPRGISGVVGRVVPALRERLHRD